MLSFQNLINTENLKFPFLRPVNYVLINEVLSYKTVLMPSLPTSPYFWSKSATHAGNL